MRKLLLAAAGAASVFAAGTASAATTIVPQDNSSPGPTLVFDPNARVEFGATYTVEGEFTDTFYFKLNQDGMLTGGQLGTQAGGPNAPYNKDLDITLVNLNTGVSTLFSFSKSVSPPNTDKNELFTIPNANLNQVLAAGTYHLVITGEAENVGTASNNTGSYSGYLEFASVAAVPEPSTWAMMLMGFGAVGYSMRSRKGGHRTLQAV
jgi:hypothetical protein